MTTSPADVGLPHPEMGNAVITCRRENEFTIFRRASGGWLSFIPLFVWALFMWALIGLLPLYAVGQLLGKPDGWMFHETTGIVALCLWLPLWLILVGWFFLVAGPRRCRFVLHQQGLRYRGPWNLSDRLLLFDDLDRIEIGERKSKATVLLQALTREHIRQLIENQKKATLIFHRKNGKTTALKALLLQYDHADLERVFDYVIEHHPRLLSGDPTEELTEPSNQS